MSTLLDALHEDLAEVVRGLDPDCVAAPDAAAMVETFAAIERLAHAGKTMMARRVAGTAVWARGGDRSAASWLARVGGTSVGEAMATLQTADRLTDLPATEERLRAGQLSRVQAHEITAAATADPDAEARLLAAAPRTTVKGLKERCAGVKAAARDEAAHYRRVRRDRCVRTWTDGDGSHLHLQTTPDAVQTVLRAMQPYEHEAFEAARRAGEPEPASAYAADALVAMAREALAGRPGQGAKRRLPRAELRLRCDVAAFERGHVAPGETCEIPGIGPVPVELARSVASDAVIDLIVTQGVDVRSVVSLGRSLPRALRVAVEERYGACAKWDCDAAAHLEHDHVVPYRQVRETRSENIVPWCPHHHDLKTYRGYRPVQLPDGQWDLLPPDASGVQDRSPPRAA